MRRRIANNGFYFLVCFWVLVAVVWLLTDYINTRPYFFEPMDEAAGSHAAALSKAQDAYAAVSNLLTTLATGLLASLGIFFTRMTNRRDLARVLWPAVLSALCVCLSVYFGYISSQNVGWAIEFQIPTMNVPKLQVPRQLQFFSLVAGVYLYAEFLRRNRSTVD
jgi:hypothetical protein